MSDSEQNKNQTPENPDSSFPKDQNEIDDYTQKLLDKQVEYLLFPEDDGDVTTSSLEGTMSEEQRRVAEETMLSALDQLRKERGQVSIEEEENQFARSHPSSRPNKKRHSKGKAQASKGEDLEPSRYEVKKDTKEEGAAKKPASAVPFYKTTKFKVILAAVIVLGVLFGAYAWKVTVYDPAHVASVDQDAAYKRLVNYADEFSMMSDAQKRNLVNLENDYNSLPAAKKTEIDEYFLNPKHTGKSFTDLLAEMKDNTLSVDNPEFADLLSFAQGFNAADEATRATIVDKIDVFNALEEDARNKIDEAMKVTTGKTFTQVYNDYVSGQPISENPSDPAAQPADNTDALQAQLDSLRTDRDNYAQFLAEEGLSTDDILQQYDAQIADLQSQLGQ